jgi:coproporphyrinogen III oxidase
MSQSRGFSGDDAHDAIGGPLGARAHAVVSRLQDRICAALEQIDGAATFQEDPWQRPGGGGGRSRVLQDGAVFEKAGVSVSAVHGEVPAVMRARMPGDGDAFFATGVSLVLHPLNPNVPTTHANFRFICRGSARWFGGGADLTPYVLHDDDARHFHAALRAPCDAAHPDFYPSFKRWCDRYFRNTHRDEARGVGGIFFDDLAPADGPATTHARASDDHGHPPPHDLDLETLWGFWEAAGDAFLPAYLPIVERRRHDPWDEDLRRWQLQRRGRYVEFNLLHDRGTKFGLQTQGRIESIFMSLPPLVRWDYGVAPDPGSPGARLLDVLKTPRDWLTES